MSTHHHYHQPPASQANSMGIGSMILGIISLLCLFLSCCGLGWIGVAFGVLGLAIGTIGFFQSSSSGQGMGFSIAGIALNLLGAVTGGIIAIFFATVFAGCLAGMKGVGDAQQRMEQENNRRQREREAEDQLHKNNIEKLEKRLDEVKNKGKKNDPELKKEQDKKPAIEAKPEVKIDPEPKKVEPKKSTEPDPAIEAENLRSQKALYITLVAKQNAINQKIGPKPPEDAQIIKRLNWQKAYETEWGKAYSELGIDAARATSTLERGEREKWPTK